MEILAMVKATKLEKYKCAFLYTKIDESVNIDRTKSTLR